jgi:hypothetical protein
VSTLDVEAFLGQGRHQGVKTPGKGRGEIVGLGQLDKQRSAEVGLSAGTQGRQGRAKRDEQAEDSQDHFA